MFCIRNLYDNKNIETIDQKGPFRVIEYIRDLSVNPGTAITSYFASEMNIRRRQVVCDLSQGNVIMQAGAMQMMFGKDVGATTGIKGVGDLMGKAFRGKVTGESAVKPEYTGNGIVILEPTYKHLLLLDVAEWSGGLVMEDGMFLCCEASLRQSVVARSNFSSAVAGGEGFFNLALSGNGIAVLESPYPQKELLEVTLENDVVKIDGNMAVCWSGSLDFTVEKAGKSFLGSMASGEGLVNVYRGTGKVLIAPVPGQ